MERLPPAAFLSVAGLATVDGDEPICLLPEIVLLHLGQPLGNMCFFHPRNGVPLEPFPKDPLTWPNCPEEEEKNEASFQGRLLVL